MKASEAAVIAKSLEGTWQEELLFVLGQEFDSYQGYQKKMAECDEKLQEHLGKMEEKADPKTACPEYKRNKRAHGNVPEKFDLREELYRSGVDLTAIDGINGLTAQTVIAEVGYDMSRFSTEGHFVSFLAQSEEQNQRRKNRAVRNGKPAIVPVRPCVLRPARY